MTDFNQSAATRLNPGQAIRSDPSLNALPLPSALFDLQLRLVRANPRFLTISIQPESGRTLGELLLPVGTQPVLPEEGRDARYVCRTVFGEPVAVCLSRSGEHVGVTVVPSLEGEGVHLDAVLEALATTGRAQNALLELSREVALADSEDALVACMARSLRALFPGRYFCVRIVDPQTFQLTSLYADGRLLEAGKQVLAMRRVAADKAHLDPGQLPAERVMLTEEQPLVFAGAQHGFATPLAAGGTFFGLVNLEYPKDLPLDEVQDEMLLSQLANQAAVAVKNLKLIDELLYVKKHLEELIESANALIVAVGREGQILLFNRALEQLTGHSAIELLGQDLRCVVPEAEHAALGQIIARCERGERLSNLETRLLTRDGSEVRVSFNTATLFSPSGELEGVIAIGQDLTTQKALEQRVMQAEKLASLGQMAAGVVHEINNPLTTIGMYAEALISKLSRPDGDAGDLEKALRIQEAGQRILDFSRELTSYARPAHDRPERLDVHALLEQALGYCELVLRKSEVQVKRALAPEVPRLLGVKNNLVQVFVNLFTNASHAMDESGGTLAVTTRLRGEGVEVRVSDTGKGISEKNLARLFEPFFTTKDTGQGTGLGLAIVQGIISKHGGTIVAESEEGVGTTFTVWLPS